VEFNALVHEQDEHGDPVRTVDGDIRLKSKWKNSATDPKGRKFNPKIHVQAKKGEHNLDAKGFLKVKRRDAARTTMGSTNRSEALVNKHREPGYAYYLATEDRQALFEEHDWEDVMDEEGPVTLDGGQGRAAKTVLKLKKKPQEWYDEDQKEKTRLIAENLKSNTKPDQSEGQYGEGLSTHLR